jgi:hypothetical protein
MGQTSRKARGLSTAESLKRARAARFKASMMRDIAFALSDDMMINEASLIVFTKGQMRGLRATIKRLRMIDGR